MPITACMSFLMQSLLVRNASGVFFDRQHFGLGGGFYMTAQKKVGVIY